MDDEPPNQNEFISSIRDYYQKLLGYKPEQTFLQNISEREWDEFAEQRRLNPNSSGIYLPRNQRAIIRDKNLLSLFHEYFGHGLYCEQSLLGRKLVDLEKKLLEEEKIEFLNKQFTLKDLDNFRRENETFNELENFRKENLATYELFAIWTEYLLSGEFNLRKKFDKKYDSLKKQDRETIDSAINFSDNYGDLATFYEFGLARRTTLERAKKLLKDIYGDKLDEVRLILLTGSKKPFSDIDLFASSDYLQTTKNDWLDLVVFNEEDFERRIKLFEVQVTYPIMFGEFVVGDKNYLEQKKKQLQEQPITEEAIKHNFRKAEEQKKFAFETRITDKQKQIHLSYFQTYLANALVLKEGKRIFDKDKLILYSQSEKLIELKGGSE